MRLTTDAPDHLNLKERYAETLRGILEAKTPSYGRCGGIRHLLDVTATRPALIRRPEAGRTWVWSDLHLGDTDVMEYCRRPFEDADAMDRAIMAAWTAAVGPGDTVLNGGDVALSGALGGTRRTAIEEAPGRKLLVVGNHDFNPRSGLLDAADHDAWTGLLVIETDPPAVMTHRPPGRRTGGLGERPRPPARPCAPRRHAAHQRVRRAHGLPAPPLESLVTLAKRLLTGDGPEGATTVDRIRSAEAPACRRPIAGESGCKHTERATTG